MIDVSNISEHNQPGPEYQSDSLGQLPAAAQTHFGEVDCATGVQPQPLPWASALSCLRSSEGAGVAESVVFYLC